MPTKCEIRIFLTDENYKHHGGSVEFTMPSGMARADIKDYIEMSAMLAYAAAEQQYIAATSVKKEAGNE